MMDCSVGKVCHCSSRSLILQILAIIVPAFALGYLTVVVMPELRSVSNAIKLERQEEAKHFERINTMRKRINTEHALLLLDLEESRKLAQTVNSLLKIGD